MPDWIPVLALALLALNFPVAAVAGGAQARRCRGAREAGLQATALIERLERELRDELGRQGQGTRADLATFQQMLLAQSADVARTQNEQLRQLSESNERRAG